MVLTTTLGIMAIAMVRTMIRTMIIYGMEVISAVAIGAIIHHIRGVIILVTTITQRL